jgi:hypothetical protein
MGFFTSKIDISYFDKSNIDYNKLSVIFLSMLIFSALSLKLHLVFRIPINQDEFHYLSMIYKFMDGEPLSSINSFHVHFFSWVRFLNQNEVIQIIYARMVMFLLFAGTCINLFLVGRYYLDKVSSLFSVLCYISFVFSVVNGASFRHDTIATFLFLFALYLFITKKKSITYNVIAGIGIAAALAFTIKSAIYLTVPGAFILIRLIKRNRLREIIIPTSGFILALFFGFLIISEFHVTSVGTSLPQKVQAASRAYSNFVFFDQLFPQFEIFKILLRVDWIIWLFLAAGIILYFFDCLKSKQIIKNICVVVLLFPLFSILFYRNAFPYFYVFAIPTATLFCGFTVKKLTDIVRIKNHVICLLVIIIFSGVVFKNFITWYSAFSNKQIIGQKQTIDAIHQMFPNAVLYIDGCSMVSSYPDLGFFLSSAGMEAYLKMGKPVMEKSLNSKKPLFLVANVPHLNLHSDTPAKSDTNLKLLTEDWQTLRSYFIHHWGPVWVVGKRFEFNSENEKQRFRIDVPGLYTLEGNKNVLIDGTLIRAGDVITLEAGEHSISNDGTIGAINLRWGDNLYKPSKEPDISDFFIGKFL